MSDLIQLFPVIIIGLASVTIVDTLGAFASRKLQFKYGYLAVFSLIIYTAVGSYVSRHHSLTLAFITNLIIGFYDATVGHHLAQKFEANYDLTEEQKQQVTVTGNLTIMLLVAFVFTYIGYLL